MNRPIRLFFFGMIFRERPFTTASEFLEQFSSQKSRSSKIIKSKKPLAWNGTIALRTQSDFGNFDDHLFSYTDYNLLYTPPKAAIFVVVEGLLVY